VVETHQVQDGRLEIGDIVPVLDRFVADLVGCTVNYSAARAPPPAST
jgi:hypothetical protein